MKFSIIIPVYNAERFIHECVESIFEQSYDNYEIIFINDGSTDDSLSLCKKIAEKHKQVILIDQKNQGPFQARIQGIKASKGDYIIFMDSDDLLEFDALSIIAEVLKNNDSDILLMNHKTVDENNNEIKYKGHLKGNELVQLEKNKAIEILLTTNKLNNLWGKVFKSYLVKKSIYSYFENLNLIQAEDHLQMVSIILNSNSILYVNKTIYRYRINRDGTTSNFRLKNLLDILEVRSQVHDILNRFNSKYLDFFYKSLPQKMIRLYLRYIQNNKVSNSDKNKIINLIKNHETFIKAKPYIRGQNKMYYSIIEKNKKITLRILEILYRMK